MCMKVDACRRIEEERKAFLSLYKCWRQVELGENKVNIYKSPEGSKPYKLQAAVGVVVSFDRIPATFSTVLTEGIAALCICFVQGK